MEEPWTRRWVEAYQTAWTANEPDSIRALFTQDAEYRTSPFADPWVGVEGIVQGWLARQDTPGNWTFRFEVLVETPDLGVVRGWTDYANPKRTYSNIWLIRFDNTGRATSFIEWVMPAPAPTN